MGKKTKKMILTVKQAADAMWKVGRATGISLTTMKDLGVRLKKFKKETEEADR